MKEGVHNMHFHPLSAVFPVLLRGEGAEREVLLHLRQNTGCMDGHWDFVGSGHIEAEETAKEAVIRECAEEGGITVSMEDIRFAHAAHRVGYNGLPTYCDYYFIVSRFEGTPVIAEPHKCADMRWFPLKALPDEMIPLCRRALNAILNGIPYEEYPNEA